MILINNKIKRILIGIFNFEVISESIVQLFPNEYPKYTNTNVQGILPKVVYIKNFLN